MRQHEGYDRWTEPLDSERERWYLGIECDGEFGERRGAACMRGAGRLPMRERRCAHYGRGAKRGQRDAVGRARPSHDGLRCVIEGEAADEPVLGHAHGGGWV